MYLAIKDKHLIPVNDWVSNDHTINKTESYDLKARKATRHRINALAETLNGAVKDGAMAPRSGNLTHYHTHGIYARELFIPAGTVMVSKLHKLPRLCIILSGDVSFTTEYGSRRVVGPHTEVFPSGSRVALFTHEDTVWTAIHGTHETDLEILEENLIAKDHVEYNDYCKMLGLSEGAE